MSLICVVRQAWSEPVELGKYAVWPARSSSKDGFWPQAWQSVRYRKEDVSAPSNAWGDVQ